jgi:hypothetical protein
MVGEDVLENAGQWSTSPGANGGFQRARDGLEATGASPDTRALVEVLARHGEDEGRLLGEYARLAEGADGAVRYVVDLILQDEQRHHRVLVEIANAMAWGPLQEGPARGIPSLWAHRDPLLLAYTRKLRRAEQQDRRHLRRLRRRLRPFADSTLWSLMIDLMLLDTKKHITMLRFLERKCRRP